jgi:hypothetical protein
MRMNWNRLLIAALVVATASPAMADRWSRDRHERREDRRERREDRHERREERRDERRDRRAHRAPPAMRVERWERRPGHVWVTGHWDWNGDDYVWVGGRYERERRGYRWREPRWEQRDGVYVSIDGGWINAGPASAPPALRVERYDNRAGYIWVRGSWTWSGDQWAWAPGHYERARAGHRWRDPRWEERDGAWISVGGSWEVGN